MTVAALYCRISDDREGREVGVNNQRDALLARATAEGWTVPDEFVFVENDRGASSKSRKPRPKYDELLAAARAGRFDVVACYSTSRLTRRPKELMDWLELANAGKLSAVFLTGPAADWSSPQGRAVAITLAAWDANEAETIADRVTFQKANAAKQGLRLGGPRPFGYDLVPVESVKPVPPVLALNPAEANRIREAVAALLSGTVSLYRIAVDWNADGVLTTRGKPWQTSTVRQVLVRPLTGGLVQHQDQLLTDENGEYVQNAAPGIVSTDDYLALCAMFANPDRATTTTNEVRWLSSGLAKCGRDGAPLRSASKRRDTGQERGYRCTQSGCGLTIRASYLDDAVRSAVLDAYMVLPTAGTPAQQSQSEAITALLRRVQENAEAQAEILTLVKQRATTAAKAAPMLGELGKEEQQLNDAVTAERSKSVHGSMMTEARRLLFRGGKVNLQEAAKVKTELGERFDAKPMAERRLIARAVLRSVKVHPGTPGGAHKNMAAIASKRIEIVGPYVDADID